MCIPFTYNVYTIHILFTYNVTFVDIVHIKCVYRSHTMSLLWKPFTYNVTFVNTFDIQCHLCVYRSHTMSTLFIPLIGVYFSNGTQCHLVHHSRCIMSPSQYTSTLAPSTAPRTVKKTSKKGFIEYQRNSQCIRRHFYNILLRRLPRTHRPHQSIGKGALQTDFDVRLSVLIKLFLTTISFLTFRLGPSNQWPSGPIRGWNS